MPAAASFASSSVIRARAASSSVVRSGTSRQGYQTTPTPTMRAIFHRTFLELDRRLRRNKILLCGNHRRAATRGIERHEVRCFVRAGEPLIRRVRRDAGKGRRVEVILERLRLARHVEVKRLDDTHAALRGELECPRGLALHDVQPALRKETDALRGLRRAELREREAIRVLVDELEVANVAIAL